jgi:hypothetical protein
MNTNKPKAIVKKVKHTFNAGEVADLNVEFGQAFDNVQSVNADADAQKAVLKSRITEAEARMTTLRATINAGFEMRDKRCITVLERAQGKKCFYLEAEYNLAIEQHGENGWIHIEPVVIEPMTQDDYQTELLESESKFEAREEIALFSMAGQSAGVLAVGRLKGKWYGALRVNIPGKVTLEERLDAEQPAYKHRCDQVSKSVKRFRELIAENLGKDEAKGFDEALEAVVEAHREREE